MFRSPSHYFAHHYGQAEDLSVIAAAAVATHAAIEALDDGDVDLAHRLWCSIDGGSLLAMWDRWNEVMSDRGPVWIDDETPEWTPPTPRTLGASDLRSVFQRDGFRCQYCGIPVFTRRKGDPIVRLVAAFPDVTPGLSVENGVLRGTGKSGSLRNADTAKWLWSFASPDHVVPLSRGGDDHLDNVVTACAGCNYSKWDLTLDQLSVSDPRHRTAQSAD